MPASSQFLIRRKNSSTSRLFKPVPFLDKDAGEMFPTNQHSPVPRLASKPIFHIIVAELLILSATRLSNTVVGWVSIVMPVLSFCLRMAPGVVIVLLVASVHPPLCAMQ